jgi:hypothetical protein
VESQKVIELYNFMDFINFRLDFMQFVYGIIGMVLGLLMIMYAYPIKRFTGPMGWAERIFGIGGTSSAIKIIGVLVIIASFLWMTGTLPEIMRGIFSPFIPGGKPQNTPPTGIIHIMGH